MEKQSRQPEEGRKKGLSEARSQLSGSASPDQGANRIGQRIWGRYGRGAGLNAEAIFKHIDRSRRLSESRLPLLSRLQQRQAGSFTYAGAARSPLPFVSRSLYDTQFAAGVALARAPTPQGSQRARVSAVRSAETHTLVGSPSGALGARRSQEVSSESASSRVSGSIAAVPGQPGPGHRRPTQRRITSSKQARAGHLASGEPPNNAHVELSGPHASTARKAISSQVSELLTRTVEKSNQKTVGAKLGPAIVQRHRGFPTATPGPKRPTTGHLQTTNGSGLPPGASRSVGSKKQEGEAGKDTGSSVGDRGGGTATAAFGNATFGSDASAEHIHHSVDTSAGGPGHEPSNGLVAPSVQRHQELLTKTPGSERPMTGNQPIRGRTGLPAGAARLVQSQTVEDQRGKNVNPTVGDRYGGTARATSGSAAGGSDANAERMHRAADSSAGGPRQAPANGPGAPLVQRHRGLPNTPHEPEQPIGGNQPTRHDTDLPVGAARSVQSKSMDGERGKNVNSPVGDRYGGTAKGVSGPATRGSDANAERVHRATDRVAGGPTQAPTNDSGAPMVQRHRGLVRATRIIDKHHAPFSRASARRQPVVDNLPSIELAALGMAPSIQGGALSDGRVEGMPETFASMRRQGLVNGLGATIAQRHASARRALNPVGVSQRNFESSAWGVDIARGHLTSSVVFQARKQLSGQTARAASVAARLIEPSAISEGSSLPITDAPPVVAAERERREPSSLSALFARDPSDTAAAASPHRDEQASSALYSHVSLSRLPMVGEPAILLGVHAGAGRSALRAARHTASRTAGMNGAVVGLEPTPMSTDRSRQNQSAVMQVDSPYQASSALPSVSAVAATRAEMPFLRTLSASTHETSWGESASMQGEGNVIYAQGAANQPVDTSEPAASGSPMTPTVAPADTSNAVAGGVGSAKRLEQHELERIAQEVYEIIEERLTIERESMGL